VRARDDAGNAVIEFIFVAVMILVPMVYFVTAVASIQRSNLGVSEAARDAGRAFATGASTQDGLSRASAAVRLAMADQGLPDDATVRFVPVDGSCDAGSITPVLAPGVEFAICVIRHTMLPGVPTLLAGHGIRTIGRYVVHVDDFRTVRP
jgi:Flp pilus assembly protein TadG